VSAPVAPWSPDPPSAGVPEGLSGLRAALHREADAATREWLAAVRASVPCWPPPVAHAGPSTRRPWTQRAGWRARCGRRAS